MYLWLFLFLNCFTEISFIQHKIHLSKYTCFKSELNDFSKVTEPCNYHHSLMLDHFHERSQLWRESPVTPYSRTQSQAATNTLSASRDLLVFDCILYLHCLSALIFSRIQLLILLTFLIYFTDFEQVLISPSLNDSH